jgi:uncharacterized protein (DUF58 family)
MAFFSKIIRFIYRNRSLRFTKEGLSFILFTFAVGIAAVNTGNNLLYLILAMMLSLIIVSGVLSEQCLRHLTVTRHFPSQLFARSLTIFHVRVANHHRVFPSFSIQVKEEEGTSSQSGEAYFFKIPAGATQTSGCSITPAHRGRYIFQNVAFRTRFPFGLFQKSLIRLVPDEVLVYPTIYSVQTLIEEDLLTIGTAQELNRRGTGATLYNLRDYQEGDDARNIHWKTSARQARLFSKQYEQEEEKKIRLTLDQELSGDQQSGKHFEDLLEDFESAVSLTASLAVYFMNKGYWVELQTESYSVPFGIGQSHLDRILQPLALIRSHHGIVSGPLRETSGPLRETSMPPSPDRFLERAIQGGGPSGRYNSAEASILIQACENPARQPKSGTFVEVLIIPKIKAVWPGPQGPSGNYDGPSGGYTGPSGRYTGPSRRHTDPSGTYKGKGR